MLKKREKITKPLFFAILIPEVLNDRSLSLNDRTILSIVIKLASKTGKCYANNKYFAKNLNCCVSTVSKSLNKLEKLGYITATLPDPGRGGRGRFRTVRKGIIYVPDDRFLDGTPLNFSKQPSKTSIYTNIITEKETSEINNNIEKGNTDVLPALNEKRIVEEKLVTIIDDKWKLYEACKTKYSDYFPILWNEKCVIDLVKLCNRIHRTYLKYFKNITPQTRFDSILNVFEAVITNRPAYFTDSLPKSFLKFFPELTTNKKYLNTLALIFVPEHDQSFFEMPTFNTDKTHPTH